MKTCAKCNKRKTETHYQKHATTKDGLRTECRSCRSERLRNYRKTGSTIVSRFGDMSTNKLKTTLLEVRVELQKRGIKHD